MNNNNLKIEYNQICSFLPRASYINEKTLFVPEPIHDLDISDLINK